MLLANAGEARIGGKDMNVPAPPEATRFAEEGGVFLRTQCLALMPLASP